MTKTSACFITEPSVSLVSATNSIVDLDPEPSATRMRLHCSDRSDSSRLRMVEVIGNRETV